MTVSNPCEPTMQSSRSTTRSAILGFAMPVLAAAAVLGLAAQARPAAAADVYPNKPIRVIVPYSPGGLPDTVARVFAQRLSERIGQSVVVENKPGANGVVAAQTIASAKPDGYTYLVTDGSMFSINPALYKNLSYDYQRDFVPVSLLARAPLYLAAHPKAGISTLPEFIALARSRPDTLNYGSSGIGSTHHLSMEALKAAMGLRLQHIPFKGSGQSVPALVGGQVEVLFSALPSLAGFVKGGQVKLIASNAAERSALAKDVPTIAETIPGFDFAVIVGMLAPAGTPDVAVQRISTELQAVAKMPETVELLAKQGVDAVGSSSSIYFKAIADENERFGNAIATAGIRKD